MKCYGEFICNRCGCITRKGFDIQTEEELTGLNCTCKCGKVVDQYIPTTMRSIILNLASKGYRIKLINDKTIGLVLVDKLDPNKLPKLPYEFTYDTTEPEGDIIVNARIAAGDFEGIDKADYRTKAYQNLYDWVSLLPPIGEGEYIDLINNKEDTADD